MSLTLSNETRAESGLCGSLERLFNSQADDCADLQIGGVFRYFRNEEVSLAIFNHQTTPLKFHEKADFHSFRANKSTERKLVLSLSLSGKVP